MLAFPSGVTAAPASCSISTALWLLPRSKSSFSKVLLPPALIRNSSSELPPLSVQGNFGGIHLYETVKIGSKKSRIDSWISSRIPGISRARVQFSIRSGLVTVNGRKIDKVSHIIKGGDLVSCTVSDIQPLKAEPEEIPLNIVYEDAQLLVVNKPAHMVVHPAPGNANGTLVNAVLNHCQLPDCGYTDRSDSSDTEDYVNSSDNMADDHSSEFNSSKNRAFVRPGIVHRLDKGTSGLLVVAKDEHSHMHLAEQFKMHAVYRLYVSLTSGVPSPALGRIEIPIARDSNNRTRMAAVSGSNIHRNARYASSRYKVMETFAAGGAALVHWRLETGRTHQIRAHAKYLGIPLMGDELYGGTKGLALSLLKPRTPASSHGHVSEMISRLERPCLHAQSLGFKHPHSGEYLCFSCPPPDDFTAILHRLRSITNRQKGSECELEMLEDEPLHEFVS